MKSGCWQTHQSSYIEGALLLCISSTLECFQHSQRYPLHPCAWARHLGRSLHPLSRQKLSGTEFKAKWGSFTDVRDICFQLHSAGITPNRYQGSKALTSPSERGGWGSSLTCSSARSHFSLYWMKRKSQSLYRATQCVTGFTQLPRMTWPVNGEVPQALR